ncbi:hypothetical protein [Microvirga flavescens]|uniref:hypothetical protein n=1 Tax=Microvirga flavescens TaxID=2249811 RepID=UPI000DD50741|nr:hypothetical protein [Microvirga flavescens]
MQGANLSKNEIAQLVGDVSDETIVDIMKTAATAEEIETALQWLSSEDDVMGKSGKPLSVRAAAVYDILLAEDAQQDRER